MAWHPLEHSIYQELKSLSLGGRRLLVGFSGGLDSVALLSVLNNLKSALGIDMVAVHVHHGGTSEYRKQALQFCQQWCESKGIPFYSQIAGDDLKLQSEEELRNYRYQAFSEVKKQSQADLIVTAHHQDDLLETRLLRLIRGTGLRGLRAMKISEGELLRPLLACTKEQLKNYCDHSQLASLEDPSNQDHGPMRNWLRNQWLSELEIRSPGAKAALGRSLELILEQALPESLPENLWSNISEHRAIHRPVFLTMTEKQQKAALAQYLLSLGQSQFTQNHILEVIKQLDKSQNEHMFTVAQCEWRINAQQILAYPSKASQ